MGLLSKIFGGGSDKPQKPAKPKVIKSGDWEIYVKEDGTPTMFYKNGKEWLDASKAWASPCRSYFLIEGFDGNGNACIALTTQTTGLRIKKVDDGIEQAIATDTGVAYAMDDCGTLYIITEEKASQRALADGNPDAYLLTPEVAAVATDESEAVVIKAVDLASGKGWKKTVAYEWPDGDNIDINIEKVESGIKLTTPDGTAHLFTTTGNQIA